MERISDFVMIVSYINIIIIIIIIICSRLWPVSVTHIISFVILEGFVYEYLSSD